MVVFMDFALIPVVFFAGFSMDFFAFCWIALISVFLLLWIRFYFFCVFVFVARFGMGSFSFCWVAWICFPVCGFGMGFCVFFAGRFGVGFFAFCWIALISVFCFVDLAWISVFFFFLLIWHG